MHGRCGEHFHELPLEDRFCRGGIQLAIEGDDAAERRRRVGAIGALVGFKGCGAKGDTAGVSRASR